MITRTSTTLLGKLRDLNDPVAWNRFVHLYRPMLLAYARGRGLRDADAEDVVQEVILAVIKAHPVGRFDAARGRFRDWLRGIAANKVTDFFHKTAMQSQRQSAADMNVLEQITDPASEHEPLWEKEWQRFVLRHCMDTVSSEFGADVLEAFRLTALGGLNSKQAGARLNKAPSTIRAARKRILDRIREIAKELEFEPDADSGDG